MTSARAVALALVLVPLLLVVVVLVRPGDGGDRLFPALGSPGEVARIELARGVSQVVLARRADTGDWFLPSAADAPADAGRVEAMLRSLASVRAAALPAEGRADPREPLELRLTDRDGRVVAHGAFWEGQAERRDAAGRPEGERLALKGVPALPLWASAWSAIPMPSLAADRVARVERLEAGTRVALDASDTLAAALALERLTQRDFVPARRVNWAGARLHRIVLADGSAIDLQSVPDGEAGWRVRMTSEERADVRLVRDFAFRLPQALP